MTKKEYATRNIGVTFDFVRHVIDNPDIIDTMPNGAELNFIEKDVPLEMKVPNRRKKIAGYKVRHVFEPVKG